MTLQDARDPSCRFLEVIAGSRAYGLELPTSDTDYRGVFVQPMRSWFGTRRYEQVSNETNDETFYELSRFVDLLTKNNPNMLELLAITGDCVLFRHPLMDLFPVDLFLSKLCHDSFAGYAASQISRARGLNKKILTPFPKERKTPLDFCFIAEGQGSIPVQDWLAARQWEQRHCGLVAVPHMPQLYALFYDASGKLGYYGIQSTPETTHVNLSSVPKSAIPEAWMSFNLDGYKTHCRQYQEYWQWVDERNAARYESTMDHGRGYDAKNLMHTFRLLELADEIAREGTLTVRTPSRERLLKIRRGEFTYEELLDQAEATLAELKTLFAKSSLPAEPNRELIEERLIEARSAFYHQLG